MLRASLRPLAAAGLLLATGEPHAQVVRVSPEFRVNTYTTSYQDRPVVAKAGSGNFVVAWESYRQDGSFSGVFARSFNSDRGALGPAFRVNSYTSSYQSYPDVAADTAGNFVVVWQSYRQDGSYYGVFGQRYDTTPAALASEFRVNGYTNYDQNRTSVARGPAGKIVVVWQDASRDGDGLSVYGQRYDSAGVAQGSAFRVNTYTTSSQGYPDIDADGTGNFVVV